MAPSTQQIQGLLPQEYGQHLQGVEQLARLWAGYGYILRLRFTRSSGIAPCVLKYILPPSAETDDQDEGTIRKLASYRVEANFYEHFAQGFNDAYGPGHQVPSFIARPSESGLMLADLELSHPRMPSSRSALDLSESLAGLDWFAAFHAHHWGYRAQDGRECEMPLVLMKQNDGVRSWKGKGVWRTGTYNYLQTRLLELLAISQDEPHFSALRGPLAFAVEALLQDDSQAGMTLIHGDAKAANMALSPAQARSSLSSLSASTSGTPASSEWDKLASQWSVSMFDFQYVGCGLGTQDLIKFFATALPENMLLEDAGEGERGLLAWYHGRLLRYIQAKDSNTLDRQAYDFNMFHRQWELSLISWLRFTQGWGRWGNVDWLEKRGREILDRPGWVQGVLRAWEEMGSPGRDTLCELGLSDR